MPAKFRRVTTIDTNGKHLDHLPVATSGRGGDRV